MPEHGGHALPGVVVEDAQGLVRAGSGRVDPTPVQSNLYQRPVLTHRAFECSEKGKTINCSLKVLILTEKRASRRFFFFIFFLPAHAPGVFAVSDCVHSDVSILTSGEDVFAVSVHFHVVERGLPDDVVAPGELGQSPLVRSDVPEDDGLVRTAAHHLK